jgi:hypothetical protein
MLRDTAQLPSPELEAEEEEELPTVPELRAVEEATEVPSS